MRRWTLALALFLAALASAADIAGTYKGVYAGGQGPPDEFRLSLSKSNGVWKADVSFDLREEVKARTISVEVNGVGIKLVYQTWSELRNEGNYGIQPFLEMLFGKGQTV